MGRKKTGGKKNKERINIWYLILALKCSNYFQLNKNYDYAMPVLLH